MSDFRHHWRAALTSETSPATSTQRLVGLLLAEFANRENAFAWPSAETLARRTALTDRAVRRALHQLVAIAFLAVAREGKGTSTTYQLVIPDPGTTFIPTPERRSYPPRKLTTPTPERRSETPERRSPEPLRGGTNLSATPTALRPKGATPPTAHADDYSAEPIPEEVYADDRKCDACDTAARTVFTEIADDKNGWLCEHCWNLWGVGELGTDWIDWAAA